jgi:hypothetical protein
MRLGELKGPLRRLIDFEPKQIPAVFWAVSVTSFAGLLVSMLRWQLVAVLSVFLEPFVEIAVFRLFDISLIWALIHAARPFRGSRPNRFSPIALGLIASAVLIFVPFSEINTKIDFELHLRARTAAAEQIVRSRATSPTTETGKVEFVQLPALSEDNEGMYLRTPNNQMVFFFTFRGILEHFSGFVYSATDAAPERDDFDGDLIEIQHLRKNWYWAASR